LAVLTGSQRKSGGTSTEASVAAPTHAGNVAGADSGTAVAGKSADGVTNRYEITEMAMFDLFPQTFHIETLVRLRRIA
jgi:hypothetical protein